MDGIVPAVVTAPALVVAYIRYLQQLGIVDQTVIVVSIPEEDLSKRGGEE